MASSTPDDPMHARDRRSRAATAPRPAPKTTTTSVRPHVWEFVLHPFRALRFVGALARDPRISALRKLAFVAILGALIGALLVPDGLIAVVVSTLLPVVGPVLALPADATLDWLFIGTVAYALLGLFPAHLLREHHARIFHPRRTR